MQLWKQAEVDFANSFAHLGKRATVIRLADTAAAKGMSGNSAMVAAQPSDFIVVCPEGTFFAEVKSSQDETTFHFSKIRQFQMASSRLITAAGGTYWFYIKSERLGRWHRVPAAAIHAILKTKKSANWSELEPYVHAL